MPILGFVAIEVVLRVFAWLPPDDPLMFYVTTYSQDFTPFVETADGYLEIKPDWINQGKVMLDATGRAGRYFAYPGFRPCHLRKVKPSNTIRVFVLGGSTAFGLYVEPEAAFSEVLKKRLSVLFQNREVEVINLGCAGLASTRIARFFGRVLDLDPDLVIVYSGHNEMLKGDLEAFPTLDTAGRLRKTLLSASTVFRWISYGVSQIRAAGKYDAVREKLAELQSGKIPVYEPEDEPIEHRWLPDKAYLDQVVSNYATNLQAMIRMAQEAHVPILFVLPISNIMYPPSISKHDEGFAQTGEFDDAFIRGAEAYQKRRFHEALAYLDQAVKLSPRHALTRYLRGIVLLHLDRRAEAVAEFQNSCDADCRVHRMTSRLESAMIKTVENAGLPCIDLRPTFRKEISLVAASKLFIDHCHPTEYGHSLIAEEILPYVTDLLSTARPDVKYECRQVQ